MMKITDEIAHEGAAKLGSKLCPSGVLSFSSSSLAFFLAPSPLSLSSIRALRISAMATVVQSLAGVTGVGSHAAVSGRGCCRASASSSATPAAPGGAPLIRLISTTSSSGSSSFATPSPNFASRPLPRHSCCEALPEPVPGAPVEKVNSILCSSCNGNGAVVCSQCVGEGINSKDHFNGRFKAGTICWLCRGKKQMLCGDCNGAGFMGGFMNTQDD